MLQWLRNRALRRWLIFGVLAGALMLLLGGWTTRVALLSTPKAMYYDDLPAASEYASDYALVARWDKSEVTYSFTNCPTTIDCGAAQQAVRGAVEQWDSACGLSLTEVAVDGDIRISWVPIDGPGNVLGRAYYPKPELGDLAGDLHLDDAEHWVIGQGSSPLDVDLTTVALHELGHALGLGHTTDPNAVMFAEYSGKRTLTPDDIAGIQALYGPPGPNEGQSATPLPPTGITATTTVDVKVRTGPGTSFAEIGKIPENTTVDVLGRNAAADWLFINFGGLQGWSAGWLFAVNGDVNALPVVDQTGSVPPPPQPTEPSAPGTVTAMALDTVKVRLGPDVTYAEIGKIPQGATVVVVARNEGYNWIVVNYSGLQGWAAAWLFKINGNLASVPVQ